MENGGWVEKCESALVGGGVVRIIGGLYELAAAPLTGGIRERLGKMEAAERRLAERLFEGRQFQAPGVSP